jgi:hypothetical protein
MKIITVANRKYRITARHGAETDWEKSRSQIEAAILAVGTQRNLDDPRFGCQVVGPFFGRDQLLIVRAE